MTETTSISIQYSILIPVIFTVNVMNGTRSVENITQTIRNITNKNEIIGFNAVGVLKKSLILILFYVYRCLYMYIKL